LLESRHETAPCSPLSLYVYGNSWELNPNAAETLSALRQRGMDIQWCMEDRWSRHLRSLYNTYP
jgi:hypothetical protein